MKYRKSIGLYGIILLVILALLPACGLRDTPESVSGDDKQEEIVPVAEFHDMRLSTALNYFGGYTCSEDWLYCTARKRSGSETMQELIQRNVWVVYKNGIYDAFEPQVYFEREGGLPLVLLADRENNFFMFCQDNNGEFSLEKYDAEGGMQWHTGYAAYELQGLGERIEEGIVTVDGRVFLYTHGTEGKVLAFGSNGELQEIYAPNVRNLEGLAEGKEGQVYGYCLTDESPVFIQLGEEEKGLNARSCRYRYLEGGKTVSIFAPERVCGNMNRPRGRRSECGIGMMSIYR